MVDIYSSIYSGAKSWAIRSPPILSGRMVSTTQSIVPNDNGIDSEVFDSSAWEPQIAFHFLNNCCPKNAMYIAHLSTRKATK